jgi:hypothetical protein
VAQPSGQRIKAAKLDKHSDAELACDMNGKGQVFCVGQSEGGGGREATVERKACDGVLRVRRLRDSRQPYGPTVKIILEGPLHALEQQTFTLHKTFAYLQVKTQTT